MNYDTYFKYMFESITDYRKIVLLMFLIKKDNDLLIEIGFSQHDVSHLNKEFKKILMEEYEKHLGYMKDQEEFVLEKFLNK